VDQRAEAQGREQQTRHVDAGRLGTRLSGTSSSTKAIAARARGSLTRKVLPHQYCSSSAPPVMGPNATARPPAPRLPLDARSG
jgi:hypothetical protein